MVNCDLSKKVTEIVCEIIEVEPDEINPDASFSEDLGLDSLRALEILAAIENEFSITINPEKLREMTTLNNVINVAREYINEKHGI